MAKDFRYGHKGNMQRRDNQARDNLLKENLAAHEFFKTDEKDVQDCPYCSKPVKYLSTAINVQGFNAPFHFDCVLKHIQETHKVGENQQITYLGKGTFGIIQTIKESPGFVIKEKIQIEDTLEVSEWKSELSSRIKKFEAVKESESKLLSEDVSQKANEKNNNLAKEIKEGSGNKEQESTKGREFNRSRDNRKMRGRDSSRFNKYRQNKKQAKDE